MKVICDYCLKPAELVRGAKIYDNQNFWHLNFWLCKSCNAYVGCHKKHEIYSPEGITPFGRLADLKLRKARKQLHNKFDPLWTRGKRAVCSRKNVYAWLASKINLPQNECHIAKFNLAQCQQASLALNNIDNMHNDIRKLLYQKCEHCGKYIRNGTRNMEQHFVICKK